MIDVIELLHTVMIAAGREKPKGGTAEYCGELEREAAERQKTIDAMMRDYERGKKP